MRSLIEARDNREGGVLLAFSDSTLAARLQISAFCKIHGSRGPPGDQSRNSQLTTAQVQTLYLSGRCSGQGFLQALTAREGNQSLPLSGSCS